MSIKTWAAMNCNAAVETDEHILSPKGSSE